MGVRGALVYATGEFGANMTWNMVSGFILVYYTNVALLPVAAAVVEAVAAVGAGVLVAQAGTVVAGLAHRAGVTVVPEGFPDRGYRSDGSLTPRRDPGALVEDPAEAGRRAVSMVLRHGIEAVDGTWTAVEAQTLCIHGDAPGAAATARAVRSALEAEGVAVTSFGPAHPRSTAGP